MRVEKLARLGYGAKGVVYLLIGGLALASALGQGGETTGSSGALAWTSGSTAGQVALAIVPVGLLGYALWGMVRAVRTVSNPFARFFPTHPFAPKWLKNQGLD
jgi:hypothetical protein